MEFGIRYGTLCSNGKLSGLRAPIRGRPVHVSGAVGVESKNPGREGKSCNGDGEVWHR
jgi:hypothetical protein